MANEQNIGSFKFSIEADDSDLKKKLEQLQKQNFKVQINFDQKQLDSLKQSLTIPVKLDLKDAYNQLNALGLNIRPQGINNQNNTINLPENLKVKGLVSADIAGSALTAAFIGQQLGESISSRAKKVSFSSWLPKMSPEELMSNDPKRTLKELYSDAKNNLAIKYLKQTDQENLSSLIPFIKNINLATMSLSFFAAGLKGVYSSAVAANEGTINRFINDNRGMYRLNGTNIALKQEFAQNYAYPMTESFATLYGGISSLFGHETEYVQRKKAMGLYEGKEESLVELRNRNEERKRMLGVSAFGIGNLTFESQKATLIQTYNTSMKQKIADMYGAKAAYEEYGKAVNINGGWWTGASSKETNIYSSMMKTYDNLNSEVSKSANLLNEGLRQINVEQNKYNSEVDRSLRIGKERMDAELQFAMSRNEYDRRSIQRIDLTEQYFKDYYSAKSVKAQQGITENYKRAIGNTFKAPLWGTYETTASYDWMKSDYIVDPDKLGSNAENYVTNRRYEMNLMNNRGFNSLGIGGNVPFLTNAANAYFNGQMGQVSNDAKAIINSLVDLQTTIKNTPDIDTHGI